MALLSDPLLSGTMRTYGDTTSGFQEKLRHEKEAEILPARH
jgi:hypothetical protein